jgi:hypothetical protein
MLTDFRRALARVQSDYGFYIDCQADPAAALAGYDMSSDERSALIDPEKLADVFKRGIIKKIVFTISGTHDWLNQAVPENAEGTRRDARIAGEVDAIQRASTGKERTDAVVRLMEMIG